MIEESRMKGILDLFGQELPTRSLFFATKQTAQFITPGLLKAVYHEPTLPKAFAKFAADFEMFAIAQKALVDTPVVAKKIVPPAKQQVRPTPTVTKDE